MPYQSAPQRFGLSKRDHIELFQTFTRVAFLLVEMRAAQLPRLTSDLDYLMTNGWTVELEFCFDGAGPLLGTLKMMHPQGEPLEVLRMEAVAHVAFHQFSERRHSTTLFDYAADVARELARRALPEQSNGLQPIDRLLAGEAICRLQFMLDSRGPQSCSMFLDDANRAVNELLSIDACAVDTCFRFCAPTKTD